MEPSPVLITMTSVSIPGNYAQTGALRMEFARGASVTACLAFMGKTALRPTATPANFSTPLLERASQLAARATTKTNFRVPVWPAATPVHNAETSPTSVRTVFQPLATPSSTTQETPLVCPNVRTALSETTMSAKTVIPQ